MKNAKKLIRPQLNPMWQSIYRSKQLMLHGTWNKLAVEREYNEFDAGFLAQEGQVYLTIVFAAAKAIRRQPDDLTFSLPFLRCQCFHRKRMQGTR